MVCCQTFLLNEEGFAPIALSTWGGIYGPPDKQGVLQDITVPKVTDAAIQEVSMFKKQGDAVGPAYENAQRLGYVMVVGANQQEAEAKADAYIEACAVTVATVECLKEFI